jgi:deazaflavin-dependent oxidoreductase (nitroreductase family)
LAERESQASESFTTPPRWLIPWITRVQVLLYERSDGRVGARSAGMRNLLLCTVGRHSGKTFTACLPYWLDADGERIVVASYAGGPRNPAWYHNVRDTTVNPDVRVRDGERVFRARAQVLEGSDRETVWAGLIADRPFYADYQRQTDRLIPLVRLRELPAPE